ncbi:MAG: hypothetical protein HY701_08690 [Gemmatimonadetes bacterium]|nr:hypothetical protein [Gemmatimonadota bacterium]
MEHLDLETLARLVAETPATAEQAHIDACDRCREELEALRGQTHDLGSLPDLRPPADAWPALEARLRAEGLMRPGPRQAWWMQQQVWLRAAAGVALFVAGAALGRFLDAGIFPLSGSAERDAAAGLMSRAASVTSAEEAEELVRRTQQGFYDALLRYRELADGSATDATADDASQRYAALEALVAASQAAVRHAPTDPYLNGVLLSAVAEREHMLRQIASAQGDWF